MKIGTRVGVFAVIILTALIVSFLGLIRATPELATAAIPSTPVRSGVDTSERLAQAMPNVLEVSPGRKPSQEVDTLFRVELDSFQVLEGGRKVAVSLSFTNKTSDHLYLWLAWHPKETTFAADDQGNVYRYEGSNDIVARGSGDALLCPADGQTTASLILSISVQKERQGRSFSLDIQFEVAGSGTKRVSFRKLTPQYQQQIPYSE